MAEYELDPWGEQRLDLYFAQLTAAVVNTVRTKMFAKPAEFLIEWDRDDSPEATLRRAETMFADLTRRLGGVIETCPPSLV